MCPQPTYPGVYIEEVPRLPPSVAEVETAIPAFIGYTETARRLGPGAEDLTRKPTEIHSFLEFETYFGKPEAATVAVALTAAANGGYAAHVTAPITTYLLYWAVQMFFYNGGGRCYIASAGPYADPAAVAVADLVAALDAVALQDEPTLLVVPEAVKLPAADYASLSSAMLTQCAALQDRFAIFDISDGDILLGEAALIANRAHFGNDNLRYGAAYYPFLRTTLHPHVNAAESNVKVSIGGNAPVDLGTLKTGNAAAYDAARAALREQCLTLPPSGAIAGVYAATDASRGVWRAPANVALASVVEPVCKLSNALQANLNVDSTTGKSINAIRAFAGKGTLVWGARTLAGNDNEWRYVPVRRFCSLVEESVRKSAQWAAFEPNDPNTGTKLRSMIENFLTQKWRDGALAGAKAEEAYFVRCGLGTTMDAQDVMEGRLNVEIGLAVVRPAEFIVLRLGLRAARPA